MPSPPATFCIPRNPLLEMLRLRAELNLYKIRTCRNIAGQERTVEPYAAPTDATSGMPQYGACGQLTLPGALTLRATPYRYRVLAGRARDLAALAQQMEAGLLSALEKRDGALFDLLPGPPAGRSDTGPRSGSTTCACGKRSTASPWPRCSGSARRSRRTTSRA